MIFLTPYIQIFKKITNSVFISKDHKFFFFLGRNFSHNFNMTERKEQTLSTKKKKSKSIIINNIYNLNHQLRNYPVALNLVYPRRERSSRISETQEPMHLALLFMLSNIVSLTFRTISTNHHFPISSKLVGTGSFSLTISSKQAPSPSSSPPN